MVNRKRQNKSPRGGNRSGGTNQQRSGTPSPNKGLSPAAKAAKKQAETMEIDNLAASIEGTADKHATKPPSSILNRALESRVYSSTGFTSTSTSTLVNLYSYSYPYSYSTFVQTNEYVPVLVLDLVPVSEYVLVSVIGQCSNIASTSTSTSTSTLARNNRAQGDFTR